MKRYHLQINGTGDNFLTACGKVGNLGSHKLVAISEQKWDRAWTDYGPYSGMFCRKCTEYWFDNKPKA